MQLIEHAPHFWELYQDDQQLYLAIAVDMSSVVSCWELALTQQQTQNYWQQGCDSIHNLTKSIIDAVYRGDFSYLEQHQVSEEVKAAMQNAFLHWRAQNH